MLIRNLILFFGLTLNFSLMRAQANLTVRVSGMKETGGNVMIALYDSRDNFRKPEKAVALTVIPFDKGSSVEKVFEDLPNGEYSLAVYYDEDKDEKLDRAVLGWPTEPYGFSNNARGTMGPPAYEDCIFEIMDGDVVQEIVVK